MHLNLVKNNVNVLSQLSHKENEILTFEEVMSLRELYNFGIGEGAIYGINRFFKVLQENNITTPTQLWSFYENTLKAQMKSQSDERIGKDLSRPELNYYRAFIDYLVMNMACFRMEYNREFLDKFALYYRSPSHSRRRMVYDSYHIKNQKRLPTINEIDLIEHKRFLVYITLLYNPKDLSEDKLIWELLNAYTRNTLKETGKIIGANNLTELVEEFVAKIYLKLLNIGLMEKKENIYQYIRSRYNNTSTAVQRVWNYFRESMEGMEHTEHYEVLKMYLECQIEREKLVKSETRLYTHIRSWTLLTSYCLLEDCITIKSINGYHRDLVLLDYEGNNKSDVLSAIRVILIFYNKLYHGKRLNEYFDLSIFDKRWGSRKITTANHIPLEGAALGSVISSLAHEIRETRRVPFDNKNLTQKMEFFVVRILWFCLLFARRKIEIRELKLSLVKDSLCKEEAYITVRTAKANDDYPLEFERGKVYEDGKRELDYLHIDIINEVILAAQSVYKNSLIPIENQYLFPSPYSKDKISVYSIGQKFKKIQKDNDIVHGSPITFRNKEFYDSSPEWQKMNGNPLFTPHSLRHIGINLLHVYGNAPLSTVIDIVGHRSHESIGAYTKTMVTVYEVFKLLRDNGHIDASNKLVSIYYKEIPEEIDRELLIKLEDFLDFLNEFDLQMDNLYSSKSTDPNEFTEGDSECVTETSCADTGIACLGCQDFRAGKMTLQAIINVRAIFEKEYVNIDNLIKQINLRKKEILKNGHRKVMYAQMFLSLVQRFERCADAVKITLASSETGWGLSEKEIRQLLHPLRLKNRKHDLDEDIKKYINESRKKNLFSDIDFTVYRTTKNGVVFR